MKILQIDLKEVIRKKNPFLIKIPFLVHWLKKLVHERELNEIFRTCHEFHGADFVTAALERFNIKVKVITTGGLDPNGRYVFVANHPLGGLDGVALIKAISDKGFDVRFPVNDILLAIENFQPIFMPINKHGAQSREAVKKINEAYASSDKQILMFPAGLVSRKIKGKIIDLNWQKLFLTKAIEHKRSIVPVYIDGQNSNRFYRIARWRKMLGIKINIEMLYLPDEMFRQKNKTITIVIGKPISYEYLMEQPLRWIDCIKQRAYSLKDEMPK